MIERIVTTKKLLDKSKDPWEYSDEEIPTVSVKLLTQRKGRFRAPHGTSLGSYRISGTYQGSYSLRITRRSLAVGSPEVSWFIRHSRVGTVDIVYFPSKGQDQALAGPIEPVYTFGAGTIVWGFLEAGSAYWMSEFLEGIAQ